MDLVTIKGAEPSEIIRVFPYRTGFTPDDPLAFVGHPPLFRPGTPKTPVHVSVTFTWHIPEAERIAASWRDHYETVRVSGPAYGDYGDEFTPGRYLKLGCTITSRGCVKHCGWCPERNRPLRELPIKPGWIVQDSNLLACSEDHIRAVFDMLREQKRAIRFPGGLDKHFLKPWHREMFDSIAIDELWFACDTNAPAEMKWMERAADILEGIPMRKRRCYTMLGYDEDGEISPETLAAGERRIQRVLDLGFMPFCQLYKPDDGPREYPPEWKAAQRKWCRPAAYMSSRNNTPSWQGPDTSSPRAQRLRIDEQEGGMSRKLTPERQARNGRWGFGVGDNTADGGLMMEDGVSTDSEQLMGPLMVRKIADLEGKLRPAEKALREIADNCPYPQDVAEAALAEIRRK